MCKLSIISAFLFTLISGTICQDVSIIKSSPSMLCGEGPHWDAKRQSLFLVDRFSRDETLFRYDYNTEKFYSAKIEDESEPPSFLIPLKSNNEFVVGIENSVKIVKWNGHNESAKVVRTVFEVEQSNENRTLFNDAKADPNGRFYGGTMSAEVCNYATNVHSGLYRYSKDQGLDVISRDVKVSNGLTWNLESNKFYFHDSCTLVVQEYDWDPVTGDLTNDRVIYDFSKGEVISYIPDGLTIDLEGNVYSVLYQGAGIAKIDPRTKSMKKIELPVKRPTSAAFGGPNLDILFVTSAAHVLDPFIAKETGEEVPGSAGKLLMIKGIGKGREGVKLDI